MKLNFYTSLFFFACSNLVSYSQAPNLPANPSPANQAGLVSTSPNLCAAVSDPNAGTLQVRYFGRAKPANASDKFTIILLPDTQYYTEEPQGPGSASMFNSQTSWIANNRQAMNIVYVGQLGDCTENGDNPPGTNDDVEWQRVDGAISTIESPTLTGLPQGIPYGLSVGNHDQTPIGGGNTASTAKYNQYFGVSRFTGRGYYGGHEGTNNDNHYELFTASGIDFLVISMEYDTSPEAFVLDWAANLVQTYSNRKVIVMTHFGINETGSPKPTFGAQGQAIYDKLKQYPNFMLFVCGHIHQVDGEAQRTDIFNGNTVHTLMSDYQARTGGGNGLLRIMEFDPLQNKISVKTYSPFTNTFETDADSQFELSFNMLPMIGQVNSVSSGTAPCFNWNNLSPETNYEWGMELYDGSNKTLGPVWSFTTGVADITPPTVTSVTPVSGTTGVPITITVTAIFSEIMNATTISSSSIELKNSSGVVVTANVTYNTTTRTATLTPSSALVNSVVYTATIKSGALGVKDAAGNPLASDYSWLFTTVAGDITPPTVSSVAPVNGATGISINTTASVVFNEVMNATTISSSTIELRNSTGVLTANVSYNATTRTATLTPSFALTNSTTYTITVRSGAPGVKDAAGNALASDYTWSFTTVGDITPPTVSSVAPANGATGISINTTASVVFNEAMNATTISSSTIELRNSTGVLTANVSYNATTRTATLTPSSALTNSTTYTITVRSGAPGVKDVAGNPLAIDYSWSFITVAATTQPPVSVQSFNTRTGTAATTHTLSGVPAGALLVLATTSDAVLSNCNVSSSPSLTWTKRSDAGATGSDNAELWTAVYSAGGSINVTSNWGAVSQASVCYIVLNAEPSLGGASATATSQSAPSVTITTTRNNSIIFGCTADWNAVNGSVRTLRDAATEIFYFKDNNFTTYYYTKSAATIAAYTEGISLPTGQKASTALLEIRGASGAIDVTPPTVSSVTPVTGATGVPITTTVTAIFSEVMTATTISSSTIELKNLSGVLVSANVSYNTTTRTATLTPSASLANSTVYTATIRSGTSGVKDASGNALTNDYSWSFTTAAGDITPPTVTSVTPVSGTTGVPITTTVTAIFNEAMNATTISSSSIELKNSFGVVVTANVSYNTTTRTATLTPTSALANSTVYSAKVKSGTSGVKDAAGNALASDYNWSFTTGTATTPPPVTIQSFNTRSGTAATVHSLTGVPAGALLVLTTVADIALSNCNVSSSPSLTWTKRSDAGATGSDNAEIWTAVYTGGGSINVTSNWGAVSQASVCYVVLNAEPSLGGASGTATSQSAPSVTITTTRNNSIIFGCTADWNAVNGTPRTLRDAATETFYHFRQSYFTTYFYTKTAGSIAAYTEGVSLPTGQMASTALLEIRSAGTSPARILEPALTIANAAVPPVSTPVIYRLGQNYPNPFANKTTIEFMLAKSERVNITLFDISGRAVKVLVNGSKDAGSHTVNINAGLIAKGVYYYRMIAGNFVNIKKLTIQ